VCVLICFQGVCFSLIELRFDFFCRPGRAWIWKSFVFVNVWQIISRVSLVSTLICIFRISKQAVGDFGNQICVLSFANKFVF